MDLGHLLDSRRTVREFLPRPVTDHDLVPLLRGAQGRTSDGRRTTPSAGGRHPLQLVVAQGPEPSGVRSWDPDEGVLLQKGGDDVRDRLAAAAIGDQPWVAAAPVTVALCADTGDMLDHFADQAPAGRGRRYVDVEVGAAVQNLALCATARGLGGVIVGGFDDASVADILEVAPLEPRLLFSLGHPA